jgi:hypothetical protein
VRFYLAGFAAFLLAFLVFATLPMDAIHAGSPSLTAATGPNIIHANAPSASGPNIISPLPVPISGNHPASSSGGSLGADTAHGIEAVPLSPSSPVDVQGPAAAMASASASSAAASGSSLSICGGSLPDPGTYPVTTCDPWEAGESGTFSLSQGGSVADCTGSPEQTTATPNVDGTCTFTNSSDSTIPTGAQLGTVTVTVP